MSRIGKKPVALPKGVTAVIEGADRSQKLSVKGPKGTLSLAIHPNVEVKVDGGSVLIETRKGSGEARALHGLTRALIANNVKGVTAGFVKNLEVHGTGYNAQVKGKNLELSIGFCHPIEIPVEDGLKVTVEKGKPIKIEISGIDKQKVGQLAAVIRDVRPPDPYKQKGIRYAGEALVKKDGKAFGKK